MSQDKLVYAYGELKDGPPNEFVLIIGITDSGLETLKSKLTLLVNPPTTWKVRNVVIFHEKDKDTLKQRFRETGLPIREEDLRRL